jgi:hypothetical protein
MTAIINIAAYKSAAKSIEVRNVGVGTGSINALDKIVHKITGLIGSSGLRAIR